MRRNFVRVGKGYPQHKSWALGWLARIRELYHLNRERLLHTVGSPEYLAANNKLREQIALMATALASELSDEKLHSARRKVLTSLKEHWSGLTLFVDDPCIPMDNNRAERLIRNPAVGRKNYYGSGAEWSGRLAMMMFLIFATLILWKINPLRWLTWYFNAVAANAGKAPANCESFLPWNLSELQLAELRSSQPPVTSNDSS